jgi:ribonuclease HI
MWVKPGANSYKLNIVACFFPNGTGATGAVLHDDKGQAVAGASFILEHLLDATTTEAIALQKGLQLIEDLGCSLVVIESDSLELVQAYNGVIEVWSPYTSILADYFQRARRIGQVPVKHLYQYKKAQRGADPTNHNHPINI